jgi:acyl-CoA thioesterase-1
VRLLIAVSIVAFAAACRSDVAPSDPEPPLTIPRVAVVGDSLALSPTTTLNFVTELQARADAERVAVRLVNESAWGDTTADGLRRLDEALTADIVIVALGANDGLRGMRVADIERNLDGIVTRARGRDRRVLLCGMETPPWHGWKYSIAFHHVFPTVASRHGVPLVPFLLAGVALDPAMNGPDGVHPNAAGARRIADTVWPHLRALVDQEISTSLREIPVMAAAGREFS